MSGGEKSTKVHIFTNLFPPKCMRSLNIFIFCRINNSTHKHTQMLQARLMHNHIQHLETWLTLVGASEWEDMISPRKRRFSRHRATKNPFLPQLLRFFTKATKKLKHHSKCFVHVTLLLFLLLVSVLLLLPTYKTQ